GIRKNQLIGYGLVVGLNGTGDDAGNPFTKESTISMLERLGISVRDDQKSMKGKNIAAVIVTADLPPFSRHGTQLDVNVSSLVGAKSLQGGTLLVTPLKGADGQVYAVAQGSLAVGGFSISSKNESSVTRGVPTNGLVPNGAIIEREIGFEMGDIKTMNLTLKNADFTTARRVADKVNEHTGMTVEKARDPATISVDIPHVYHGNISSFFTQIEQLQIVPDQVARIIIDEQNGIIVMGENVRISKVAVASGTLNVRVTETEQVSQAGALAQKGSTEKVQQSQIDIEEGDQRMTIVESNATLKELVDGLNQLGVTPRELINVLNGISKAGAIQAKIEVR
ncbi:flagellar basal body P-ring protein FlgI, partial [Alphaproteobacteria bacterium]|nr:flagellar basal body P-ring protein FlgI [Alphaproteobacteria bacterium]